MRKLLDSVAANNEGAALDVMRAAEQLKDEVLRQRLLNLIHRLNQDAIDLRIARDEIQGGGIKLA
jgi:chromosome condensin MukBEF MukE localization factor